jgi:TonB family protein
MSVRSLGAALLVAAMLAACAQRAPGPESVPRPHAGAADTRRVYDIGEVSVKPQLSNRTTVANALEQNYPAQLRNEGIGGTVGVRFTVQTDGRTRDIEVVSASDFRFAAPGVAVVRTMRFTPGMVAGEPVRVRVDLPVTFVASR